MAVDRQKLGLTILRIFVGIFLVSEGLSKLRWFSNPALLHAQLMGWLTSSSPGSLSWRYLEHIAIPYVAWLARLVPLGEMASGVALILGFYTPLFATLAFVMVLNFHIASGAIVRLSFFTNGYGLPVLGATLALALMTRMNR